VEPNFKLLIERVGGIVFCGWEFVMARFLIFAWFGLALLAVATPASAQYRFDPTVDPSNCHWQQLCDYGGRAYRGRIWHSHWRERCPIVVTEHTLADGRVVAERRRDCGPTLRVRG
jgi:hypothetical protein